MKNILEAIGFDVDDPGDLQDFVGWLFNRAILIFIVLSWVVMVFAIFKAGDGSLPPEPQWWLDFEQAIGVTW